MTYLYPCELEDCLSPSHLLYGRRLEKSALTNDSTSNEHTSENVSNKNKVQTILDHFWNRWRTEYLCELREQHKRVAKSNSEVLIKPNDVVVIHDDNLPRHLWRLGKIESIITSKDSQVRGAIVRTRKSQTLKRPLTVI